MIFLSKTSEELQLVTSSTAGIDFSITVTDTPTTLGMFEVGDGKINTIGTNPLLINSGAKHTKFFHLISLKNTDPALPNTIQVKKLTGSGSYELTANVTLLPGEIYVYITGEGWVYYAADGTVKTDSSGGGGGGDKNYVFLELIPSNTWIVNHFLNKYCAVSITDPLGKEIVGEVHWTSVNTIIVKFNTPQTGFVYCN
jgi:hypothetical protein